MFSIRKRLASRRHIGIVIVIVLKSNRYVVANSVIAFISYIS